MLFRLYTVRFIRARMQHSKDSRHVARCKTARSDGDCQQRSDHFNSCPDSGQAARPGRCTWQPLQHVCSSQLGSPFSVLLASSTQTSRPLLDHRCRQDGDPGVFILDYCNSLFYGISNEYKRFRTLRHVSRRRDHISPVLRQLHLLPVH